MPTITNSYFESAQLSLAAYADLATGFSGTAYTNALKDAGFTASLATQFAATYSVVSTFSDTTGLTATLFQKNGSAESTEKILAIAGTNGPLDFLTDIVDVAILGTTALQAQYTALQNYYTQLQDELKLLPGEQFAVTGHSLGGFLAQAFSVDHAATITQTYTYNAPGIGGVVAQVLELVGVTSTNIPTPLITNIQAQAGPSAMAGLGTLLGTRQDIFIEGSITTPVNNHSIVTLTDALAMYDLLARIDPTENQNISAIADILRATSSDPFNRLEHSLDALRKLFQAPTQTATTPSDREAYYTDLIALRDILPLGPVTPFQLKSLVGQSTQTVMNLAQTEIAYRYALKELNPFVVLGTNYAQHNETGELSLVNPDTGVGELTPQYLIDRAAFLSKKIDVNSSVVSLPSLTHYKDNALPEEIGSAVLPLSQVIFGDGTNENLAGSGFRDSLYGGSGDDQLFGQGGNDYLEGNRDDDTLDGGGGADTMLGGQGNDTYIVDNVGDVVREYANSGIDTVQSSVTFTFDAQVENLTLTGTDDLDGTGNELNNTITGNGGINRLDGKGGTDHLIGGDKNDILIGGTGDNDLLEGGQGSIPTSTTRVMARIGSKILMPVGRSFSMATACSAGFMTRTIP